MRLAQAAGVFLLILLGCAQLTEEELWQRVEVARANNNFDSTIQVCQRILTEYPEGKKAPAAMYLLGEVYQNGKHEYQASVNYYRMFITKYPDLNSTPLALFIVGFIYNNNLQMVDSARIAYEEFLAKFPNHELALSARSELANLGKTPDEIIGLGKRVAGEQERPRTKKKEVSGRKKK